MPTIIIRKQGRKSGHEGEDGNVARSHFIVNREIGHFPVVNQRNESSLPISRSRFFWYAGDDLQGLTLQFHEFLVPMPWDP